MPKIYYSQLFIVTKYLCKGTRGKDGRGGGGGGGGVYCVWGVETNRKGWPLKPKREKKVNLVP
jgi:hypothetical protein